MQALRLAKRIQHHSKNQSKSARRLGITCSPAFDRLHSVFRRLTGASVRVPAPPWILRELRGFGARSVGFELSPPGRKRLDRLRSLKIHSAHSKSAPFSQNPLRSGHTNSSTGQTAPAPSSARPNAGEPLIPE